MAHFPVLVLIVSITLSEATADLCVLPKEDEGELYLENMNLEYRNVGIHEIYNITTAAKQILNAPEFSLERNMYVYVHGYVDYPNTDDSESFFEALLSKEKCNLVLLDASRLVQASYARATIDVRLIGGRVGEVLADMVKNGVKASLIHVIGISIGAHISGFIAKGFTRITGSKVGRITGLDPSGPCFRVDEPELRLDASDAEFVDVIHTEAYEYGINAPIGHVNYYLNGGITQPNCRSNLCSHVMSIKYFTEAVATPEAFLAIKCKDLESFKRNQCEGDISPMGLTSKPGTTGRYYLMTREKPPYGLYEEGWKWFERNTG